MMIKSLFESSNTTESKYNIGLIQIEEGKYEESITSMGDTKFITSYNILAEHYDEASDAIDDLDLKMLSLTISKPLLVQELQIQKW